MSSVDDLLSQQTQLMNVISHTLANFKKLGKAKMTRAVTRKCLAKNLEKTFDKSQELHCKITQFADENLKATHAYFIEEQFLACEDSYDEAGDYLVEVLDSYEPNLTVLDTDGSNPSSRSSSHLPKINLPTYDGSLDKWDSFRDRFKSMIINDSNNVDRMHYLTSCLTEKASNAISNLAVTHNNFSVAWNLLVHRFEYNRRLVRVHLRSLFELLSLTVSTSNGFRILRDQINSAIQALRSRWMMCNLG